MLELGRKLMEGPAHAIMSDPRVRAAYLGGSAADTPALMPDQNPEGESIRSGEDRK